MQDLVIIGKNISKLRKEKHLTQEDLCGIANIDRSYLSEIENGHKQFSVITLLKLAKALQCSTDNILLP